MKNFYYFQRFFFFQNIIFISPLPEKGKLLPFLTSSFHVVSRVMGVGNLDVYFDSDCDTNGKIYRSICGVCVNRHSMTSN